MAKTITIACHKGGVGKTTTSASLAGTLASRGLKVLLIDLDAQMNLTRTFLEEVPEEDIAGAMAVCAGSSFRSGVLPTVRTSIYDTLDIVPASENLCKLDMVFAGERKRDRALDILLRPIRGDYDYIIIDSPAQLGTATANAVFASDCVVIPISCDAYSVDGLRQIMNFIDEVNGAYDRNVSVTGILLTRVRARRTVDRITAELLRGSYGNLVFGTVIRENAAIVQAPLMKMDVHTYSPESNGAQDYGNFTDELLGRLGG